MYRTSIFLLALATFASQAMAQSSPTGNEITIQLSSDKPWVDTALDLHSRDLLKITASQASPASSACNPAGPSPAPATTDALPPPQAAPGALMPHPPGLTSTTVPIDTGRAVNIEA